MEFPAMINHLSEMPKEFDSTWFEENVSIMEQNLDLVKGLLMKPVNDSNFNAAIEAIHFMVDKIPLMATRLQPGTPIIRARANYDELFYQQQQISYNTAHSDKIGAGRFNRPLEPLFYGALNVENKKIDTVLHCCLETCKELTDPDDPPAIQDITVGRWVNQGLLPLINLCFDERHLRENPALKMAAEQYNSKMHILFSDQARAFLFKFMEFFSQLAWSVRENECAYYILNAFFYAVRYYYANHRNTAIPGLVYPSAMTDGIGLNVVLVPQAVDYFLKLDKVYMHRFVLVEGAKRFVSGPCSELLSVSNGQFNFTKVRPYLKAGKLFTYGL